MSNIKTKTTIKDIKVLDKAASGTAHVKNIFVRSKESAESAQDTDGYSPSEYAPDNVTGKAQDVAEEAAYRLRNPHKKAADNINNAKQRFQEAKQNLPKQRKQAAEHAQKTSDTAKQTADTLKCNAERAQKTAEQAKKAVTEVKHTLRHTRQAGRQSVQAAKEASKGAKATGKGTVKTVKKSVKTTERTAKVAVKTAKQTAKVTQQSGKAAAKAAKLAAQASKAAAKAAVAATKAAVRATAAFVKATIAAVKGLVALIAAGGWIAVIIIIIVCLVGLLVGSVYGVFFSTEANSTGGETIYTAMERISNELNSDVEQIKSNNNYDVLDISGIKINWRNVLAVYAVKTAADPNNPIEVATMDTAKLEILRTVFWDMNIISFMLETVEPEDNSSELSAKTILHISIQSKNCSDMAVLYNFNAKQKHNLDELMSSQYDSLWVEILDHLS